MFPSLSLSLFGLAASRPRPALPVFGLALSVCAVLGVLPVRGGAQGAPAYPYTLVDLGAQTSAFETRGLAVNNKGQVAGILNSGFVSGGPGGAFLSAPFGGTLQGLGFLPGFSGTYAAANSVNDQGQVAGQATVFTFFGGQIGFESRIFVSGPNGTPIRDLGPGRGLGINSSGQVTGTSFTSAAMAFLSGPNGGPLRLLGPGEGVAVNESGQVAGNADSGAFLSEPNGGALRSLGTIPGGFGSRVTAVNNSGQVAGAAVMPGNITHAFLSGPNGGALRDLGTLPGDRDSEARAVNSQGQVVGSSTGAGGGVFGGRAFLFSNGVMTDLNTLFNRSSGVYLDAADGLSDTGFITAHSITVTEDSGGDGQTIVNRAYLLVPNGPVNDGPKLALAAQLGPVQNGQVQIIATLRNTGGDAGGVQVTQVSLSGASATTTPLPTAAASLPAGGSLVRPFTFPVPAGFAHGVFRVRATFTNAATGQPGTFDGSFRL